MSIIPRPKTIEEGEDLLQLKRGIFIPYLSEYQKEAGIFLEDSGIRETSLGLPLVLKTDISYKKGEYRLSIRKEGIRIFTSGCEGAHHALESLRYLYYINDGRVPTLNIRDNPYFSHRGLLLDVARHFLPLSYLKKLVNAMSTLKMNILHLHLSDDQGWRIEIDGHPEITEIGGGRPSPVYKWKREAADGEPEIRPLLSIWLDTSRIEEYSRKGYDMLISIHDAGAYLNYNLMRGGTMDRIHTLSFRG